MEERLVGGNTSVVVRIGDTVRRTLRPSSAAIHGLLRHLEDVGFDGSPRFLGVDGQGREVLRYLEGHVPHPPLGYRSYVRSDAALGDTARMLRRYHDAVATFRPPADTTWWMVVGGPDPGEVVCHNDLAPYNTVYGEREVRGFIDWDLASPARPAWDVAHLAWHAVPLQDDETCRRLGWVDPPDRARRLRLVCDRYGLDERAGLVELVADRVRSSRDGILRLADAGDPVFRRLRDEGHLGHMQATLDLLERQAPMLAAALQ